MRKLLVALAAILLLGGQLLAQKTITGKVTDEKGSPIPNASVIVKGTATGTVTKPDGTYSLTVPATAKTLVISSVDMTAAEVSIGSQSAIDVTMKPNNASLQEVVVVGYGTQQKKAFTGSASKVDVKEFANLMTPSVDKQLAGRATGVQVTNTSGTVNAPARILIRGINSINQSQGPLIVVDNIPIISGNLAATTNSNALGDINPADIEDIQVLKDGSATAIYGSRAAGGVIQITTKKGDRGRIKTNYDGFVGFSNVLKRWDLLNADQFVQIANEKLANAGQAARAGVNPGGVNTDWQDEALIGNAMVQNHTISFSGGTNKLLYYLSANYSDQQGTVLSNWNKAYRVRANLENEVNKYVKIGNNLTISRQDDADQNSGSNSLGGAIASTLRLLPNVSPYRADGAGGYNINYPVGNNMLPPGPNSQGVDDNFFNVAFVLQNNRYNSEKYRIIDNAFIDITPVKGLKIRSQFAYDYFSDYSFQAWDPRHGDGYSGVGLVYNASQNIQRYIWSNFFNYNIGFKGHNFFLTGGYEFMDQTSKNFSSTGQALSDIFFMKENLISGSASTQTIGGGYSKSGFTSIFGRLNYDYKNRYFAQATFRRDGQSSLAPDKRYGDFPGFSVGWRPSEEGFWKGNAFLNKWFPEFKVKASYAKVGTTLGGLPYLSTFGTAPYGNLSGIAVNGIGNADLQWETSAKYDVGVEFAMLDRRINVTADWFLNDIDNLVLGVPTPLSAGIPGNSISQNIGSMENRGIELAVDALVIQNKDFSWNVNVNFSNVQNKITNLYSISGNPVPYIQNGAYNLIRVGDPYNIIYGYESAGVNTATGNPMYYKADGRLVMHNIPNNTFYYINGKDDGTIVPANATTMAFADRKKLGLGVPTYFGAISNTFTYKGLTLDFMFRYSGGNKIMNTTRQEALLNQSFQNNGTEILERWTTAGQVTNVPKLYWGQGNNINQNGLAISRFVENGNYIRLQNVVLSYAFGSKQIQNWTNGFVQNLRVYAQGQNLAVWTKYKGADPDNISGGGVDASVSPQIRTVSFGLSLGL